MISIDQGLIPKIPKHNKEYNFAIGPVSKDFAKLNFVTVSSVSKISFDPLSNQFIFECSNKKCLSFCILVY